MWVRGERKSEGWIRNGYGDEKVEMEESEENCYGKRMRLERKRELVWIRRRQG